MTNRPRHIPNPALCETHEDIGNFERMSLEFCPHSENIYVHGSCKHVSCQDNHSDYDSLPWFQSDGLSQETRLLSEVLECLE